MMKKVVCRTIFEAQNAISQINKSSKKPYVVFDEFYDMLLDIPYNFQGAELPRPHHNLGHGQYNEKIVLMHAHYSD